MVHELLAKYEVADPICGFHCPPGWLGIVDDLLGALIQAGWDRQLTQLKSKFGSLRVYIGAGSPELDSLIIAAEREADKTCEQCGSPGQKRSGWWIKTLCEACWEKR